MLRYMPLNKKNKSAMAPAFNIRISYLSGAICKNQLSRMPVALIDATSV